MRNEQIYRLLKLPEKEDFLDQTRITDDALYFSRLERSRSKHTENIYVADINIKKPRKVRQINSNN